MYTLNYVFDSELKVDSPPESAGILEFQLIPADSPWNTQIPWILPGFRGESVGEWRIDKTAQRGI